jgi:hypothetical protein
MLVPTPKRPLPQPPQPRRQGPVSCEGKEPLERDPVGDEDEKTRSSGMTLVFAGGELSDRKSTSIMEMVR